MELPVAFKKGAGIVFAVPITRFNGLSNAIFMSSLNTCQTRSVLNGGGQERYTNPQNTFREKLTALEQQLINHPLHDYVEQRINELVNIIPRLYRSFNRTQVMSIIEDRTNRILTMNFVGWEDWDHVGINQNREQQLISQFLSGTDRHNIYTSRSLSVLINNGGNPREGRNLSTQEIGVTNALLSFFENNNFPYFYNVNGDIERNGNGELQCVINRSYRIANERRSNFRLTHYIQSLFTSIMLFCIDEPAENRGIIFGNIQQMIDELEARNDWTRTRHEGIEAIDFLIHRIINNTYLIQQINENNIKMLANNIYNYLDDNQTDHVTQIEFVKFDLQERKIKNGFMTNNGYFYIPLATLLKKYATELRLNLENDPVLEFLNRIEKFALQFETVGMEITNYSTEINVGDLEIALTDINTMHMEERNNFIEQFNDEEIGEFLKANLAITSEEIINLPKEFFRYVPINKLEALDENQQCDIFLNRIECITNAQLQKISPTVINMLLSSLIRNQRKESLDIFILKIAKKFSLEQLPAIDFSLLNTEHINLLLNVETISKRQIQQLDLSTLRLEIIRSFLDKRFDDLGNNQFGQISKENFRNLDNERKFRILDEKMEYLVRRQLRTLNLQELRENDLNLFDRLIRTKYMELDINQFIGVNFRLDIHTKDNLPSELVSLLKLSQNPDHREFMRYLLKPNEFPLSTFQIIRMSNDFKLIYLNNHANIISDNLKEMFTDTIRNMFEHPEKYCSEILLNFINEWPQDLITPLINSIAINNFPKMYLYNLFERYTANLSPEQLNEFQIKNLNQIGNLQQRIYIFNVLLNHYVETENINGIRSISINNLSLQEIEILLTHACHHLTTAQLTELNLLNLSRETLLLLLQEQVNNLLDEQVIALNYSDPEVARLIIESDKRSCLHFEQIHQINNFSEIGDNATRILINMEVNGDYCFYGLRNEQIQQIKFILIESAAQREFIRQSARLLTEEQVQGINFEQYCNQTQMLPQIARRVLLSILQSLNNAQKLNFLLENQIRQLVENSAQVNIFMLDDNELINSMFLLPRFAEFFTNNQLEMINDETFQNLNLGNVERNFLNYIVRTRLNDLNTEKISQINLSNLQKNNLEALLRNKFTDIEDEQIRNLNLQDLEADVLNRLVSEKVNIINIENLQIDRLSNETQLILLNARINELDGQINNFGTTNIAIARILVANKFNLLSNEQIRNILFTDLSLNEQVELLSKLRNTKGLEEESERRRDLSILRSEQIQAINLPELKNLNLNIYLYLLMLKSDDLHINQLMTVNWLRNKRRLLVASQIFLEKLGYTEQLILNQFVLIGAKEITEEILDRAPVEFKVAFLNSRYLNGNFEAIEPNFRRYFLPEAIDIMFQAPNNYLTSVEYVINNWQDLHDMIQNLVIVEFSTETISTLLRNYLFDLSPEQLQSLNISDVDQEIIEYAILNRAQDFLPEQFTNLNFPDAQEISEQLINLTDENIPNLNLETLPMILRDYLLYKKIDILTDGQINQIDYTNFAKIKFILENNRENEINQENARSIDLERAINELEYNLYLNLIKACAKKFDVERQIQILDAANLDIINILLENDLQNKLSPTQIKQVTLNNLEQAELQRLIVDRANDLDEPQIQALMPNKFNTEIAAMLIITHANHLTQEQIRSWSDEDCRNINEIIKARSTSTFLTLMREANRYHDLSDEQFNEYIGYTYVPNIVQILSENQQHRTTQNNARRINLSEVRQNVTSEQFLNLLRVCLLMFNEEQIQTIETAYLNVLEENLLRELIIQKLPELTEVQINLERLKNILFNLESNIILRILETHGGNLKLYHIQRINAVDAEVAATLLINHINDLSREQIRSWTVDNWLDHITGIVRNRVNRTPLDLIQDANRYEDLSDEQFNRIINHSCTSNIVQILRENLQNRITQNNARRINLCEVRQRVQDELFFNLIRACVRMFDDDQFKLLNTAMREIAKIIREQNLCHRLQNNPEQIYKFNVNELGACDAQQLRIFAIPGEKGNCNIAIGILLYKFFNKEFNDQTTRRFILQDLRNVDYERFNEVYFAKCIMLANDNFNRFPFASIAESFFIELGTPDIFRIMTYKKFTRECRQFNITPRDLRFIIEQKLRYYPNEKYARDRMSEVNSRWPHVSYLGNEYQDELRKININRIFQNRRNDNVPNMEIPDREIVVI